MTCSNTYRHPARLQHFASNKGVSAASKQEFTDASTICHTSMKCSNAYLPVPYASTKFCKNFASNKGASAASKQEFTDASTIWYGTVYILLRSVPDPVGSGFKLPGWIRIRIRYPDPESEIEL